MVSDDLKEVLEAYRRSHHAGARSITQVADSNVRRDARCAARGTGDDGLGGSDIAADDGNRLGRAIGGIAREKHNIKRADRLLSNSHLQSEREAMYGMLAQRLVGQQTHPVLLVDWSDLDEWRRNQVVRVSLADEGRALTVYEEVHGRKTAVKPKTHVQFLHRLQAVLPVGCRPILVTDAGFKTPWFQAVESLGWYWV